MSRAPDPRHVLRELCLGLADVLPYARAGTSTSQEGTIAVATAKKLLEDHRRIDRLPWAACLEVSISHLTASEIDALQSNTAPDPFIISMSSPYAWLLHLPASATEHTGVLGPGLAALYRIARDNGFTYVRLDADAATIPSLSVYD